MFKTTQKIIKAIEAHVLRLPSENELWGRFTRYIVFPIKFLLLGLRELFKPWTLWAWLAFVFMVAVIIASKQLQLDVQYSAILLNVCIYSPAILVIFSVPSTYAYYGLPCDLVSESANIIGQAGIDSEKKIEIFESNIQKIQHRIDSRVSFYKWFIGATWAFYILTLNFELRILLKITESGIEKIIGENALAFVLAFFFTLGAVTLVAAYKRASDYLIKSIEYGCSEQKYRVMSNNL